MNSLGRVATAIAFTLLVRSACCAQEQTADEMLADAKAVYSQQGAKTALPKYEKALAAYRDSDNKLGEAITMGLIGNCYKHLGDYPKALEMLNTSLSMKRELHERLEEGKTLSNLGLIYWERTEYSKAIQNFSESIAIAQELGNVQLEASATNNLGLVYDEQGDYRRSMPQFEKALELHRSIEYEPGESDALGNIGGVYLSLGRFSQAESYYRQALEISRRLGLKSSETLDLGNISLCQLGQGETKEALTTLNQALEIADAAGMYKEFADWLRVRASARLRTGRFDLALKDYETAEQSYVHARLKREEAEVLMDVGMVYFLLGDRLSSEAQIKKALAIARAIGYKRGVVADQLDLATLQIFAGNLQRARITANAAFTEAVRLEELDAEIRSLLLLGRIGLDLHQLEVGNAKSQEARKKAHDAGLKLLEAEALILSGELDLKRHRPQDAIDGLNLAKAISTESGDVDLLWQAQFFRGQALERLGQDEEAVLAYRAAIDTIEDVRTGISERRFRTGYFQNKQRVYVALISLLLRMGDQGEAFGFSERLREYSFLQFRGEPPESSKSNITESKARVRQLQTLIDQENGKAADQQRGEIAHTYSEELAAAQRELRAFLDSAEAPAAPQIAIAASSEMIQSKLPAHTALVEYVVSENELLAFVITRSGLQSLSIPAHERDLRSRIELLRDLVADPKGEDWQKPAAGLRTLLIAPLENRHMLAEITSLLIVPHGVLNELPFAALPTEQNGKRTFLIEQYELRELPSGSWLLRAQKHDLSASTRTLAVAPSNSQLKFAIPEAQRVALLFSPRSFALIGSGATETRFKQSVGQYDFIHLATHGFFNSANPAFSGLQLEPDAQNDGRLEVHEILSLHLNARMVTLSACDTALGSGDFSEFPAGDEFVGLNRAFLEAGSDAVLASLWKVDDHSTEVIMDRLYRAMKRQGWPGSARPGAAEHDCRPPISPPVLLGSIRLYGRKL